MTLYEIIKAEGIEHDSHESDLYVPVTPRTTELVRRYSQSATTFRHQIKGTPWYDVPFAYTPWWQTRIP